ncbi:hypothetical protein [Solidesulfovibrio alcoholivorans]|uniref:hypothetical protein n=1 Tax=Solidesulfovibrio alcoholivorans TaxID=81406 RepID=UPI001FE0690A|nr:hypothetical protein [Solidesulfovibrio alcoholivorans]
MGQVEGHGVPAGQFGLAPGAEADTKLARGCMAGLGSGNPGACAVCPVRQAFTRGEAGGG